MAGSEVSKTTIAVLGGGNSGFATAAALSLHGHTVRLLEISEMAESITPIQEERCVILEAPGLENVRTGEAQLASVTTDPAEALGGAEVVLFALPAYGGRLDSRSCA
jgi:opine dehydrogenase